MQVVSKCVDDVVSCGRKNRNPARVSWKVNEGVDEYCFNIGRNSRAEVKMVPCRFGRRPRKKWKFQEISLNLMSENPHLVAMNRPVNLRGGERTAETKAYNNVLLLCIPFFHNYSHCLADVIPKLMWYDTNHSADVIYTNTCEVLQSVLDTLNIKFNKIVFVHENFKLDTDVVDVHIHSVDFHRDINHIKLLKDKIDEKYSEVAQTDNLLIYCTRNSVDAKHGRQMGEENEQEIISILQSYCEETGLEFTIFNGLEGGTTMCYTKQIELFNRAKVVIGPHGGAFANILFCNPKNNVTVCEFTSGTQVQVHGLSLNKHYNKLFAFLPEEIYDYYLIPFEIGSTAEFTYIDTVNLKTFLTKIVL